MQTGGGYGNWREYTMCIDKLKKIAYLHLDRIHNHFIIWIIVEWITDKKRTKQSYSHKFN